LSRLAERPAGQVVAYDAQACTRRYYVRFHQFFADCRILLGILPSHCVLSLEAPPVAGGPQGSRPRRPRIPRQPGNFVATNTVSLLLILFRSADKKGSVAETEKETNRRHQPKLARCPTNSKIEAGVAAKPKLNTTEKQKPKPKPTPQQSPTPDMKGNKRRSQTRHTPLKFVRDPAATSLRSVCDYSRLCCQSFQEIQIGLRFSSSSYGFSNKN
jgi:hypothetical protein